MTVKYPNVTIDGVVVYAETGWDETSGVKPHVATFDVLGRDVGKLTQGPPREVTLHLGEAGDFQNLYVTSEAAPDIPAASRVVLEDCRTWWDHAWVRRSYNVRRRYGVQRLSDPTNVVAVPIDPILAYTPCSLDDGVPWTAKRVLQDVCGIVFDFMQANGLRRPELAIDTDLLEGLQQTVIDNLEVDAAGDEAIGTVLRFLPGADIFVAASGDVVAYSTSRGGEARQLAAAGPELVGKGHIERISLARKRPAYIDVLFSREIEVRWDYHEYQAGQTISVGVDSRTLTNVLQNNDFNLALGSRTVCEGTWVPVLEALPAWGLAPGIDTVLTTRDVQMCMVPYMGLMTALGQTGSRISLLNWPGRIGSLEDAYRQVFQIPRRWMDKISALMASRVGTIDTQTGLRAPAAVYSDYAYLPSARALYQQMDGDHDGAYCVNVARYPTSGILTPNTSRASARVTIIDEDQGVFRLDYLVDRNKLMEGVFPSQIELDGDNTQPGTTARKSPGGDFLDIGRPFFYDMIAEGMSAPKLTSEWACAVILTAVPAIAQSGKHKVSTHFHVVRVKPAECGGFKGQDECYGPGMQIRVGPGIETARVCWKDDRAEDIEKAFGLLDGDPQLDDLTMNNFTGGAGGVQQPGGASLQTISHAVATRVYFAMADRFHGSATSPMTDQVEPEGWLRTVQHRVTAEGEQLTILQLPESVPRIDLMHFLDSTTQRIIMHAVFPGRS